MRALLPMLGATLLAVVGCGDSGILPPQSASLRPPGAKPPSEPAAAPAAEGMTPNFEVETLEEGSGDTANVTKSVTIHYVGKLLDGTVFDSSRERGEPFNFRPHEKGVIKGLSRGITGKKAGAKLRLTIPPDLAYGERGKPPKIPPNATLVFEVEILSVK